MRPHLQTDYPRQSAVLSRIAALLPLIILLALALMAFPGAAHNGMVAGNRAMALSAAIGVGALWVVLFSRRWPRLRALGRIAVVASLGYLVVGALMANGRWATLPWRIVGYVGTIGAAWAAEWILQDRPDEITGFMGWVAAGIGLLVVRFEVLRAAERIWRLPAGQQATDAWLAQGDTWRLWWTLWAGAVYVSLVAVWWVLRRRDNPRK